MKFSERFAWLAGSVVKWPRCVTCLEQCFKNGKAGLVLVEIKSNKSYLGHVARRVAGNADTSSADPWAATHDLYGRLSKIRRGERQIEHPGGDSFGFCGGFFECVRIPGCGRSLVLRSVQLSEANRMTVFKRRGDHPL